MSTTKHVKFSESTDFTPPAAEQPRTNAFAVHPDRLAAVEAASSKAKAEKKTKTKVSSGFRGEFDVAYVGRLI